MYIKHSLDMISKILIKKYPLVERLLLSLLIRGLVQVQVALQDIPVQRFRVFECTPDDLN